MKYYALLLFLFAGSTFGIFSQSFAPLGAEWHYNKGNGNVPPNSEYYHCKVTNDTVYAGHSARKIEIEHFRYAGDSVQLPPLFVFDRNDSVFYYNEQHQRYLLLYDFTANVGDTLLFYIPDTTATDSIFREVVDSISFISTGGKVLKKIHTSSLDYYSYYGGYTELVGSELLMLPQWSLIPFLFGPIRCYRDSSIFIQFSTQSCDHRLVTSLQENEFLDHRINIYPNPVSKHLEIKAKDVQLKKIELFDLQGKSLQEFSPESEQLDFGNIEDGIYLIRFTTANLEQLSKKVIVQQ